VQDSTNSFVIMHCSYQVEEWNDRSFKYTPKCSEIEKNTMIEFWEPFSLRDRLQTEMKLLGSNCEIKETPTKFIKSDPILK
jgi:hypothetical protein